MSKFSRNLAFVVGINNYGNGISSLQNAVNDAKKLIEVLRKQHEYHIWVCLDEQATLEQLHKLLDKTLPQEVQPDDRLLFYFAGHGIALNGEDGPEGYLIPHDAKLGDVQTYLPMTQLQAALEKLPCRHFLGILDCCFAGAFRWSSTRDFSTVPEVIYQERYDRFIQDPAWQIITSAAYDQKALDAFTINTERGRGNHSPFAAALLEALAGDADVYPAASHGQPAGDGVITATELYLYLRDRVEPATVNHRQRQTPGIWPLKKHDKGEYIFLTPGHVLNLPPAPPLDASQNPYLGLKSFEEEQSDLFFGRQTLTEKLHNFVNQQPLTVVLGASGSGKSSLVKAGLIPHLKQLNTESNQQQWYILPAIRPGEAPLKALNNTLAQTNLPGVSITKFSTEERVEIIHRKIAAFIQQYSNIKLLLVIDQLEEIITLCKDDKQRENFLQLLAQLITKYSHNLRIVLTLRSDFEPQFQDTGLKQYWTNARFIVPQMTRVELRQAIEEPASKRVMYFKSENPQFPLIDRLIDEVADMPGALPLLSFTLSELYLKYLKRQQIAQINGTTIDRAITETDYQELGGVARSLTQRADSEYNQLVQLDPTYAHSIRHVMLRMVAVGGELARRRVSLSELEYPPTENQRVQEIIRRFTDARLLVEGQDTEGNLYVEPAHDALVRGWQKLLNWKQEEEENLILQRRLTPAAFEWQSVKSQKQTSGLLTKIKPVISWLNIKLYKIEDLFVSGINNLFGQQRKARQNQQESLTEKSVQFLWNSNPYLDVLKRELQSNDNWFNQVEAEFVQQSVLQKRQNISLRWRIAIAVILILIGLILWALANLRQATIRQITTDTESADGDLRSNQLTLYALSKSLQAGKTLKNNLLLQGILQPDNQQQLQIIRTLRKAVYTVKEQNRLEGFTSRVANAFWQGDTLLIVTIERNNSIKLLNKQSEQLAELPGEESEVEEVFFSPDGSRLVISQQDGSIRLWDWQNNPQATEWKAHQGSVTSISFSPNGRQFVTVGSGIARLWDLSGNLLQEFSPQNRIITASFRLDGQLLIAIEENTAIRLFESSGKELARSQAFPVELDKVIISRDGERLVIIYGSARSVAGITSLLWNWKLQSDPEELGNDIIVGFSPDGTQLATAGANDGTVRLRNWIGSHITEFKGDRNPGPVVSINFRSNGKQIAATSVDGKVRLWALENPQLSLFKELSGSFKNLSFSQDGKQLVTQQEDGTVRLLDLSGNQLAMFKSQYGLFNRLNFSPNRKQIATIGEDRTVRLLDLSGNQLAVFQKQYDSNSNLSFSPDGKQLAVIAEDGNIRKLNLSSGEEENTFNGFEEGDGFARSVIWKPDGNILAAVTSQSGRITTGIRFLDLQAEQWFSTPIAGGELSSISFNNDGSLIATAQDDGIVSLWYSEGNNLAEFPAHKGKISSISLSPDSSMLATIGEDGTAKLWQLGRLDELLVKGCDRLHDYLNNPKTSQSDRSLCKP